MKLSWQSHVDSSEIVERLRAHGTKRRKGTNTKFGKTDVGRFENREGDQPGECWINLNPIIGRTDSPGKREDTEG